MVLGVAIRADDHDYAEEWDEADVGPDRVLYIQVGVRWSMPCGRHEGAVVSDGVL